MADSDVDDLKNTFAPLYNHSATPTAVSFEQIMQKIRATEEINVFKKLNTYQQESPISFAKIMERLRELGYFKNTTSANVISFDFIKKIAAAAAVLLFLIAGYFMYNKTSNTAEGSSMTGTNSNPNNSNNNTTNNSAIDLPVATDSVLQSNSTAQNNISSQNNIPKFLRNSNSKNSNVSKKEKITFGKSLKNSSKKNIVPKQDSITINGENFTILENDYLLTFASFTPDKLPIFLQAENPAETQITVDKYSYFNVTDVMGAMMKKMYATKSGGAPTRSAKKQKQKLESWKKADSAYFLPGSNLNPIDPRDLGNLILNK
jgi:hypothetical protein